MTRPITTKGRMHVVDGNQHVHRYSTEKMLQKPYELKSRGHSPSSVVFSQSSNFPGDQLEPAFQYSPYANNEKSSSISNLDDNNNIGKVAYSPSSSTPDTSVENERDESVEEKGLQFVPSLEVNKSVQRMSLPNEASVSWDAIMFDDAKGKTETPFPPQNQHDNRDAATSVSGFRTRKVGDRIAQLASMFSSRATVQVEMIGKVSSARRGVEKSSSSLISYKTGYEMMRVSANPPTPVSPAPSSGSSAYIGWPGTQDKHGQTVIRQSSNDDSSIGGESSFQRRRCQISANTNLCNRATQKGAFKDSNRWKNSKEKSETNWDDSSSDDSDSKAPLTRQFERVRRNADSDLLPVVDNAPAKNNKSATHSSGDNFPLASAHENAAESQLAVAVGDFSKASIPGSQNARSDVGFQSNLFSSRLGYRPSVMSLSGSMNAQKNQSSVKTSVNRKDLNSAEIISPKASPFSKAPTSYVTPSTEPDSNRHQHSTTKGPSPVVSKQDKSERFRNGVGPPTQSALDEINRTAPPLRTFPNSEGFMGLLQKTKDVPCLLDTMDSDSMSSSKATSVHSGNCGKINQYSHERHDVDSKKLKSALDENSPRSIMRKKPTGTQTDEFESESDVFDGISSKDSDVFDNLSTVSPRKTRSGLSKDYPARIAEEDDSRTSENDDAPLPFENHQNFRLVVLAGGITTIQTTDVDYSNRLTACDYDDQLTASEVSSNGYTRIPGFEAMIAAGTSHDSSLHGINGNIGTKSKPKSSSSAHSLVLEDIANESDDQSDEQSCASSTGYISRELAHYSILPFQTKKLLGRYRELSELYDSDMSLEQFEREEDEHKAFALSEMRSRIMETDIERGLERRGGTTTVDDIVTTRYYRSRYRIRDAVIVCKAWRDGASMADVVKAFLLSQRHVRTYHIKRCSRPARNDRRGQGTYPNCSGSVHSGCSSVSLTSNFHWEPVKWLDDADAVQYRCASLGSRCLKGFEIFTIGDCQSMLLKLTNERCMELRQELNAATSRLIHAEEMLKEENDYFSGEMTETEFAYLASMEEVKIISKKLVKAEKSFTLVRDRIKNLIAKYESILSKIERGSSVVTYESSCYSERDSAYWDEVEQRDREMWERRAQRAELRAEIAAREAFLAKQETRMLHEVKQRELDELRQRLFDVQSEVSSPSHEKENSAMIAKSLVMRRCNPFGQVNNTTKTVFDSKTRINNERVNDVKQRFRERMAAKKQDVNVTTFVLSQASRNQNSSQKLFHTAGEEMFQQMDFYERSLNAVERTRV